MNKRQEGSAMIVVMCVMVMACALSLALLLSSSVLIRNAQRANQKEQCRITAVSVSDLLKQEIAGVGSEPGYVYEELPKPNPENKGNSLKDKLQSVLTTEWYSYDKHAGTSDKILKGSKAYFSYELTGGDLPGSTVADFYWIDETGENLKELDFDDLETASGLFQSLKLYVKVTSTVGEESSTILSVYHPVVNTQSEEASGTGQETVKWVNWTWQYDGRDWERGDS